MIRKHNRKLGLIGVSLTKARTNRNDNAALTLVRDDIEPILDTSGYLVGAPFGWVTVAIRYGIADAAEPSYQRINKQYGDLPLAIEVDTHRLDGLDLDKLAAVFRRAVLIALVHAGKRYGRPTKQLELVLDRELNK